VSASIGHSRQQSRVLNQESEQPVVAFQEKVAARGTGAVGESVTGDTSAEKMWGRNKLWKKETEAGQEACTQPKFEGEKL